MTIKITNCLCQKASAIAPLKFLEIKEMQSFLKVYNSKTNILQYNKISKKIFI